MSLVGILPCRYTREGRLFMNQTCRVFMIRAQILQQPRMPSVRIHRAIPGSCNAEGAAWKIAGVDLMHIGSYDSEPESFEK